MGLSRRPEVDQVGSGVCERHVGSGATAQSVQDSTFVHVLQVAQVLAQVLLRGITLQRGSGFQALKDRREREGTLYLLRLVLRHVVQGAVRVQAHPHHAVREFGGSLIRLQLGGCRDEEKSQTHFDCFILFQKEIVILVKKTTSSNGWPPKSHYH